MLEVSASDTDAALPDRLVKQRAKSGVFFVGSLGAANLTLGFAGSVVLARILAPADFGIVAIGTTLMMVSTTLADGGLASGMIRREQWPTRGELRAGLALQLALTGLLGTVAAGVGIAIGGAGLVVATMMAALPVAALQTPGRVVCARQLRFRALASAEAAGVLSYYAFAVTGAIAGLGVWALALAVVVKAVVAASGVTYASRLGVVVPTFRGARSLRPVLSFGLRFQAVSLAVMGREYGLNGGIAAISGVATLGLWSLTRRMLELPLLLFEPLHRVTFPLLSHMRAAGEDAARLLDRGVAIASTASGIVLVPAVAAAPGLVPAVFGERWAAAAPVLQLVCAALLISGPVAVMAVGYLYAVDAPSVVLRATILHTLALFAVAFPLLPALGATAIGVGAVVGAVVEAVLMAAGVRARSAARPLAALAPTLALAGAASAAGALVTAGVAAGLAGGVAGATVALAAYATGLALVRRPVLVDTLRMIAGAVRGGLSREDGGSGRPGPPVADTVPSATPSQAG